jgi:cytochrome o ubiquinol oxidase subunit 3
VFVWLGITMLFGLVFLGMEVHEFASLVHEGAGPDRSGFLSGFFTLVGTHGLHVTSGIVWMLVLMAHLYRRGLTQANMTRLMCLSLFWHFLDIVWIGVFTIVYLMGVA